jgi:ABC-2 type transport system permease protein
VAARADNASAIFDLGYKGYGGARLGRPYAVASLFYYSLRGCFGIGRKLSSKFFPFGITALVAVPALLQVGVAAVVPAQITVVKPESYFGVVQVILALFCAAVAPELLTRDRRNNTLPLYFSRALQRNDYALAKAASLTTALFLIGLFPQLILFAGNALGSDSFGGYFTDNAGQIPPIFASCALAAAYMASIALAVTALTHRKAYATAGVIATFVVLTFFVGAVTHTASGEFQRYISLIDPFTVAGGNAYWLFGATATGDNSLTLAHLPGYVDFAALVFTTIALFYFLLNRYQRLAA